MDFHTEVADPDPAEYSVPAQRRWLHLGGPWPVTIKIVLLKLFGLGLLLTAVLSHLALREHAADSIGANLTTQADALVALLRGNLPDERTPTTEADAGGSNQSRTGAGRDAIERLLDEITEASGSRAIVWGRDGGRIAVNAALSREHSERVAEPPPPDVASALGGKKSTAHVTDANGDTVVSVTTPLTDESGAVVGALTIRSGAGAVVDLVRDQERAVYALFGIAAVVLIINAIILAVLINRRLVRLAQAAERVRGGASVYEIPEPYPNDTVGELAGSFRAMAISLTQRMAATEAFAADVAHELKNPLTSLRSAVETLPLARNDKARESLLHVIAHDVRRIDRLINDISDASRLDRELSRARFTRLDLVPLLHHVVSMEAELAAERSQKVTLRLRSPADAFTLDGSDSRLSQVFINLLDNARSFTPEGGAVTATAQRIEQFIEVVVDDEGPGIDEPSLERIFERFYTDRPGQASFGNNSGLGLAISRQIVSAHGGEIFAENRHRAVSGQAKAIMGARFTVRLPAI